MENFDYRNMFDELNEIMTSLEHAIETLTNENLVLAGEVALQEENLDAANHKIMSLEHTIKTYEEELARLKTKMFDMIESEQNIIKALEADIRKLENINEELKNCINSETLQNIPKLEFPVIDDWSIISFYPYTGNYIHGIFKNKIITLEITEFNKEELYVVAKDVKYMLGEKCKAMDLEKIESFKN